jgi:hypothetical protein
MEFFIADIFFFREKSEKGVSIHNFSMGRRQVFCIKFKYKLLFKLSKVLGTKKDFLFNFIPENNGTMITYSWQKLKVKISGR